MDEFGFSDNLLIFFCCFSIFCVVFLLCIHNILIIINFDILKYVKKIFKMSTQCIFDVQ